MKSYITSYSLRILYNQKWYLMSDLCVELLPTDKVLVVKRYNGVDITLPSFTTDTILFTA